jgi:hypothetical protein
LILKGGKGMLYQLEDVISGQSVNIYGVKSEGEKTYFLRYVKENIKERNNPWCWVDSSYYLPM